MPERRADDGFTLVELLVAIALLSLMMAIAVGGFRQWAAAHAQQSTAREVQTTMRQAQQQAVTEGRALCVWFDLGAGTYSVYRGACEAATKQLLSGPLRPAGSEVAMSGASFTGPTGATPGVTFYARGTATPGQVQVVRTGTSKVYTLTVEGLTGRVSLA